MTISSAIQPAAINQSNEANLTPWARHERDQRRRERNSTTLIDRLRWLEEMAAFAEELAERARNRRQATTKVTGLHPT